MFCLQGLDLAKSVFYFYRVSGVLTKLKPVFPDFIVFQYELRVKNHNFAGILSEFSSFFPFDATHFQQTVSTTCYSFSLIKYT